MRSVEDQVSPKPEQHLQAAHADDDDDDDERGTDSGGAFHMGTWYWQVAIYSGCHCPLSHCS